MVLKNDSEATVLRKSRVARERAHVRLRAGERTDVTKRRKVDERVFRYHRLPSRRYSFVKN